MQKEKSHFRFEQLKFLFKLTTPIAPPIQNKIELHDLWKKIRVEYFPEHNEIDNYRVLWSKRKHSSCLASCNYQRKKVIVADVMSQDECYEYLEPLLYHEMCHAVLGKPAVVNGRRVMHGREFKALERRHPQIKKLDAWLKTGGWNRAVKKWRKMNLSL